MDAILSTSGAVVRNYAIPFAKEKCKSVWYLKDDIDRISLEVDSLVQDQGTMEAAEKKQLQDEGVRNWVRDLKNVRYDLEDVKCDYRVMVVSAEDGQGVLTRWMGLAKDGLYMVCGVPLSCLGVIPDPVITPRVEIARMLKSINRNLVEINKRKAELSLVCEVKVGEGDEAESSGPPLWPLQESPMIGRTETKKQIKAALLDYAGNEGSGSKLFVIGIVGAGGMGKTTLAHNIYTDEDVVKAFPKVNATDGDVVNAFPKDNAHKTVPEDNKKWLYVGEKFDVKRIMNKIIGEDSQLERQDDLHKAMREKFKDQRLLIVLDDVWCDNSDEWHLLQSSLSKGAKAHALIVTTRSKAVARAIRHDSKYSEVLLEGLPDTECMDIFERGAFKGDGAERYRDGLEGLSRQVVQKLKGNPLAATMMGTFLNKHLDKRHMWLNVVKDWPPNNEGDVVDRVVGLSYFHLLPDLKSCFAYCAMFPKGHEFDKKTLVRMWIAQGYVQPPIRGVLMEHTGSDHFDDLYQRSFFQKGKYSNYYTMHDLIHDFAQKVFTEGCLMDASDTEDGTLLSEEEIRHLSFYYNRADQLQLKRLEKFKKLRTLMLGSDYVTIAGVPCLDVLAKFKYLRVLVLDAYELSELPDSIRHLKFLRYLDISGTVIRALPESVCDLVELQCLQLPSIYCALPEGMNKLINLRYIEAGDDEEVPQFKGIGQLTSLQGSVKFNIQNKSGWKISELKGLNHLHGRLMVRGLRNVTCKEEAEHACLRQKEYLEELVLYWTVEEEEMELSSEEDEEEEDEEEKEHVVDGQVQQHVRNDDVEGQVLEGLFPPPNLKVLNIYNNRGARFPCWMEEQHDRYPMSYLVTLELDGCCKWECLPTLGRCPCLRELVIGGAHGVKKIGPEFFYGRGNDNNKSGRSYFPRLEMLQLRGMSLWEEWETPAVGEIDSSGGGGGQPHAFPSLKKLCINDCPKLHSLSPVLRHLTNLETVQIWRCAELASSRLKELRIVDCPKLASLAPFLLRHSTDLETIKISGCDELASLYDGCGWTPLPSRLKELRIEDCPKLASLAPFLLHHLTDLEALLIWGCAELASLYDGCGSSMPLSSGIKKLSIRDCPKLASQLVPFENDDGRGWMLPSGLRKLTVDGSSWKLLPCLSHLTALQDLEILQFPNLRCIPPGALQSLRSLEELHISDCPAVESLPDGGLPPSLKSLRIFRCPLLKGRCREGGPDRPKIPTTTQVYLW